MNASDDTSTRDDPSPQGMPDPARLEDCLGHEFSDRGLLTRALTHRSAVQNDAGGSYERLEFLGDRILGFVIADLLLVHFPDEPEGHLSKRLQGLVRKEALAEVAGEIELGPHIRFGAGDSMEEERDNPAILSDVCEALIAALYLDGGMAIARGFVERYWKGRLGSSDRPPRDAKSSLQEWTLGRGDGLPQYEIVDRTGPDHSPVFIVEVRIPGQTPVRAEGRTKRAAEQAAASAMLGRLSDVV